METRTITVGNDAHDVTIECQLSGDPGAPTMVLLHALGERAASWDPVVGAFASRFRVIALDLRGHGASDWPGEYSFELMRDDVLGVLDDLDAREVILVGHSMGGAVAYLVAQAQPGRITRLVVEDVPPPFPRTRAVPERPAESLPFDWAVVPAIVEQVNDPTLRYWPALQDITAPTLLIGGGEASHIPQDRLVEVSKLVSDCTLITIAAGHNSRPDAFAEAVLAWLESHAAGQGPGADSPASPRRGLFWDGVEGRAPVPQAAQTLGFELIDADVDAGRITVGFDAVEAFTNPNGEVLGGFVAAMLFDTVGPAVLCTLGPGEFITTDDLHVRFHHPASVGRIFGRGWIVARSGDRVTLEATATDSTDRIVATATAEVRVVPLDPSSEG